MNSPKYFIEPVEPELGMGCTLVIGSDRYPATIIETNDKKTEIVTQADLFVPDIAAGYEYYSNQVYLFNRNLDGKKSIFTLRKTGQWVEKNGTQILSVGHRDAYQDPSF